MKHFTLSLILMAVFGFNAMSQPTYQRDSIQMGASYVYDVYYSMSQGEVSNVLRNNWDIAFRAYPFSASIMVNDGAGGMLWAYPNGDYTAWSTVDTAGITAWTPLYNVASEWELGAFNVNASGAADDYGWGTYNSVTHNITGDSIFILKTVNGPYKKVAILSKQSLAMIYTFRIASLDGSGDTTVTLDASAYDDKNYAYFDATTNAIVDREPLSEDWDIVFTKYYDEIIPGMYYGVTGVLQNIGIDAARYEMADTSNMVWDPSDLMSERNTIGYNWKAFSGGAYVVDDSMYFLVEDQNGDLYKLVFEGFAGSSTGKVFFRKALISPVGMGEIESAGLKVFPVPSSDAVTVVLPETMTNTSIRIYDIQGRMVQELTGFNGNLIQVDISTLTEGIYLLKADNGIQSISSRIVKN